MDQDAKLLSETYAKVTEGVFNRKPKAPPEPELSVWASAGATTAGQQAFKDFQKRVEEMAESEEVTPRDIMAKAKEVFDFFYEDYLESQF